MASDINTKNAARPARSSFDKLMDLYWGGSERRITGLTLRIMAINALGILILMLGALSFDRYQTTLIATKLEVFQTQAKLIAEILGNSNLSDLSHDALRTRLKRLQARTGYVFILSAPDGTFLAQSNPTETLFTTLNPPPKNSQLFTFTDFIQLMSAVLPDSYGPPSFPETDAHFPDLKTAFQNSNALNAWRYGTDQFILATSLPLSAQERSPAKLYILRSGQDIVKEVLYFWQQIFNLFLVMLGATVLISIYLSGLIARPLRQLTRTAALIRRKKTRAIEIPDLSARHDEIGELSLVMRDMTESLWSRLDSIEQFAADVAHELKNPLTSLKSALETLKIVKKKEDQKQLLDILQHDIERMDRLITDISLASRLDAELSREKHQAIDLSALLRKIIHRYQTHYGQDYQLALYLPERTALFVEASEGRLTQVLDNLLDNALSFTPQHKQVSVTAALKGSSIMVTIDDDGPGIPPAKLTAIFDRFYSERRGEEHFGQHSGLGLAICKQIIEAIGGTIRAENKPAGGARFVISLMAADL